MLALDQPSNEVFFEKPQKSGVLRMFLQEWLAMVELVIVLGCC